MHVDSSGRGNRIYIRNDSLVAISGNLDTFGDVIVDVTCACMQSDEEGRDVYYFDS